MRRKSATGGSREAISSIMKEQVPRFCLERGGGVRGRDHLTDSAYLLSPGRPLFLQVQLTCPMTVVEPCWLETNG